MKPRSTFLLLLSYFAFCNLTYSQDKSNAPIKICTNVYDASNKVVGLKPEKWTTGQRIRVKFLGGDNYLQSKVKQYAAEWSKYCNIKFEFVSSGYAEIRVNFVSGIGSWSLIGKSSANYSVNLSNTSIMYRSKEGTTINFGWFDLYTPEEEFRSTIIHEFGHALGLVHEHQTPAVNIPWNKPVVYSYYLYSQGWDSRMVDNNIFYRYSKRVTQYSQYDKLSIMHYPIPASLLNDPSFAVDWNNELSETDKSFIGRFYPPSNKPRRNRNEHQDQHGHQGVGGNTGAR